MTLRFWAYVNGGFVRITLRPGDALQHVTGGATDEGYDWTAKTWTHDGDSVHREFCREARDCDGRMTWGGEDFCGREDLCANSPYWDADDRQDPMVMLPEWAEVDRRQRDYQAEAAGY